MSINVSQSRYICSTQRVEPKKASGGGGAVPSWAVAILVLGIVCLLVALGVAVCATCAALKLRAAHTKRGGHSLLPITAPKVCTTDEQGTADSEPAVLFINPHALALD